ncbi:Hypothetical protein HVR_LOCUS737 [uncultured virus]|nr:Hypothetical protein HVR_LOCUS737 [uncultured virus]
MAYPRTQTSPFDPELGSEADIALNRAILESLRPAVVPQTTQASPGQIGVPPIPSPTWNAGTQFVPVQTTTTFVPVTNTQTRLPNIPPIRTPTVPIMPTIPKQVVIAKPTVIPVNFNTLVPPLSPSSPFIPSPPFTPLPPFTTNPQVPIPLLTTNNRPVIPTIPRQTITAVPVPITVPRLTTNTGRPIVPPLSPRTNFPPILPVILPPTSPFALRPTSPRSPGRMTQDEEYQMRIAIMESIQDINPRVVTPPIVRSPPRTPLLSPVKTEQEDIEDALLQAAIAASIQATEQARLATFHANQLITSPYVSPYVSPVASPVVSPRTQRLEEDRLLREQQEVAYQEALKIDRDREATARMAADAASKAAQAAEEATRILQAAKLAEEAKRETLQPPILQYPVEAGQQADIYLIRFRLPEGGVVNHSFNKNEPIKNVIQQLRFDIKHVGNLVLTIPPNTVVNCDPDVPISDCGFGNKMLVMVAVAK